MTLCACGCGGEIIIKPYNKRRYERMNFIPRFITTHHMKRKVPKVSIRCMCGCNQYTRPGRRYVYKHYNHIPKTEEIKRKISISEKGKPGMIGEKNPNWQVPCSLERKQILSALNTGKRLSEPTIFKMSGKNNHNFGMIPSSKSGFGKRSYYASPLQGQVCFRSSYELAYAKYLDSIHELWMYEMETFDLGNTTYTPDFFLPRQEKFIEIKGYMRPEAQEKINQFKEQYPWDLEVLGLKELKEIGAK